MHLPMSARKDCPEWIDDLHFMLCHYNHTDMSAFDPNSAADWDNENWDYWSDLIDTDMDSIYLGSELKQVYRSRECGSCICVQVAL